MLTHISCTMIANTSYISCMQIDYYEIMTVLLHFYPHVSNLLFVICSQEQQIRKDILRENLCALQ
jgi:hypothetical protein